MSRIQHLLMAVIAAVMTGDFLGSVQDANPGIGGEQGEWAANRLGRDGVVVEVKTDIDGLGGTNGKNQIGIQGMQGRRQQARLFLGEDLGHGAGIVSGPGALMGDLISPEQGLTIAFLQGGEVAAGPEGFAYVTNGAFDPAFLIAGPHLARAGDAVVVGAQLQQPGMEVDLVTAPLQYGATQIVMKNDARLARPGLKGMDRKSVAQGKGGD